MQAEDTISEIDELRRQIRVAEQTRDDVEALVALRDAEDRRVLSPDTTIRLANAVVERVQRHCGTPAQKINIFQHMNSFFVRASPEFLIELLKQPEVANAVPNRVAR